MCPIQHVKQFFEMITQFCEDAQFDPSQMALIE